METLFAICATYEVDDGGARGFVLQRREPDGTAKPWPILVTRKGNHFYGFENACPHQGARLDQRAGEFMDEEGNFLVCGSTARASTSTPENASSGRARARLWPRSSW